MVIDPAAAIRGTGISATSTLEVAASENNSRHRARRCRRRGTRCLRRLLLLRSHLLWHMPTWHRGVQSRNSQPRLDSAFTLRCPLTFRQPKATILHRSPRSKSAFRRPFPARFVAAKPLTSRVVNPSNDDLRVGIHRNRSAFVARYWRRVQPKPEEIVWIRPELAADQHRLGFAVFVGASVSWKSGAQLNPRRHGALTMSDSNPQGWDVVPVYITAQVLGAMFGAVLAYLLYKKQFDTNGDNTNTGGLFTPRLLFPAFGNILSKPSPPSSSSTGFLQFTVCSGNRRWCPGSAMPPSDIARRCVHRVIAVGTSLGGATGYRNQPSSRLRSTFRLLAVADEGQGKLELELRVDRNSGATSWWRHRARTVQLDELASWLLNQSSRSSLNKSGASF